MKMWTQVGSLRMCPVVGFGVGEVESAVCWTVIGP